MLSTIASAVVGATLLAFSAALPSLKNKQRCIVIATAILAWATQSAHAQVEPRSPDRVMGGCHEGLLALETALDSVDEPELRADINVIIEELYRATDLDDGRECRRLLDLAWRTLEIGPLSAPQAAFSWDPSNPPSYTVITFDGSRSTDADGEIARFAWDFGDGTTAEGKIVQHIYRYRDNFTIRLTVYDNDGLTHTLRADLPITATNR